MAEGLIKIQVNLQKSIQKALVNFNKSPKQRVTLEYVEVRADNLDKDWLLFRSNHYKLLEEYYDKIENDEYFKNEIYDSVEDTYMEYRALLKSTSNKLAVKIKETDSNKSDQSKGNNSSLIKLPKISIPLYSGKYSEWNSFRDLFISLIQNNNTLDNVQKLHYLKSHLTGEAEQLIRHTPITDSNYSQCWSLLESRYNNKKYLSNCIFKRLFSQKRMFVESASALKDLLDTTTECLHALQNLMIDVSTWDSIIIYVVTYKLDPETRKQWELKVSSDACTELPTLHQFKNFVESRFRAVECIESKKVPVQNNSSYSQKSNTKCEYCSDSHKMCFCKKFIALDYEQRRQFVVNHKICYNCLGGNHTTLQCLKPTSCRVCKRRHHTLLHSDSGCKTDESTSHNPKPSTSSEGTISSNNSTPLVSCFATTRITKLRQVLLATALVKVQSASSNFQILRAFLDQGSHASFVTDATVQFLRLKKTPIKGTVSGLGDNKNIVSRYMVSIVLQSLTDVNFEINVNAYVLKNITSYLPERKLEELNWTVLEQLPLADPQFNAPNKIDILLGADVYAKVLKEGIKKNQTGSLVAQCTRLGWILSGTVHSENTDQNKINNSTKQITTMHVQVNENDILKKFWEIEEQLLSNKSEKILTDEEQQCENLFTNTTKRTKDGRYVVNLPFRNGNPSCVGGNSRDIAVNRLMALEDNERYKSERKI
ncbi:uncharacterized protein LOC131842882 [Achroia grisella]|uniref:uncharacterized protein LOC131842882 n=1 Tax=Achroia grisella TaxID=688607 RepID=UPI0027D20065|nr:uncharacterized protein LOC131842882 [Achroia grisella]